jgi:hypothetical protein
MPDTRANVRRGIFATWTCRGGRRARIMLAMSSTPPRTNGVQRVVLVPATPISSRGRSDELVRRYRLARLRLTGAEATAVAASARIRGG